MSITVNDTRINWGRNHPGGAFPSGEPKLERCYVPDPEQNLVRFHYGNDGGDEELFYLWVIARDLKYFSPSAKNILWMDYVPNGRLDKSRGADGKLLPGNEDTGALINEMGWSKVYGVEPHSSKFVEHYNNAVPVYPTATSLLDVRNSLKSNRNIQWVFPDKGALLRYSDLLPGVTEDDVIIVGKHRTNGVIDKTEIESGTPRVGYDLVIVDDLCSKGGTFYGAANRLREAGADGDIYLVISHLESTVYAGELLKDDSPIKRIFVCTKSLGELPHPKITYVNSKMEVKQNV